MTKPKRRNYTNEFKEEAVKLVTDQGYSVSQADRVYCSGLTYLWTAAGWLYLAVVIDLYSRKVVGGLSIAG